VIGYGIIQSLAPVLIQGFGSGGVPRSPLAQAKPSKTVQFWTSLLTIVPGLIAIALQLGLPATITIVGGLMFFGIVFAFNSAVHSYLVLAFTDDDKVALDVGFYYKFRRTISWNRAIWVCVSVLWTSWLFMGVNCTSISCGYHYSQASRSPTQDRNCLENSKWRLAFQPKQ
jgi:hypothetical protein